MQATSDSSGLNQCPLAADLLRQAPTFLLRLIQTFRSRFPSDSLTCLAAPSARLWASSICFRFTHALWTGRLAQVCKLPLIHSGWISAPWLPTSYARHPRSSRFLVTESLFWWMCCTRAF